MDADKLLTDQDLLLIFHRKNKRTITRWVKQEALPPCVVIGKSRFWRQSAIFEFVAQRETPSGRAAPRRTRRSRRPASPSTQASE